MSSSKPHFPRLRHIEVYPIEHEGNPYYYLRDPLEVAARPIMLTPGEFLIASLFNGEADMDAIKSNFALEARGAKPTDEQVMAVLHHLRKNCYLDDAAFRLRYEEVRQEFHDASIRKAWHAGTAYPIDPDELREQLDAFYSDPNGASSGDGASGSGSLQAVMVPHIDLRVDGPCYTHAYRHLFEQSDAELFVVLGVAHNGGDDFLIATEKDFETPLGVVKTNKDFVKRWSKRLDKDVCREEFMHRSEHSIEFQLPFLQHGLKRDFEVVNILSGSIEYALNYAEQEYRDEMNRTIDALAETLAEEERKTMLILSVDLAHMGPKFGDVKRIDDIRANAIRDVDKKMFRVLEAYDSEATIQLMQNDLFSRRIDACGAIYTLMRMLPRLKGKMLSYGQDLQGDSGSIVTYGCMAFEAVD
ncbi:MAG: AmmeMemoRadiSam system protein B [Calditrichia bacterium]